MKSPIGLFEAFGIEIELMIVDQATLDVRPWADKLLTDAQGELVSDYEDGPITWSNELVSHVIEFKTTSPAPTLEDLEAKFYKSQQHASKLLAKRGARLMPTGMHPWMNPLTETVIWPHDNNEIYSLYNKIFDCRGHGWSNLQSVHINLPFKSEHEFTRLHSAIRAILPIIPALSASTPIADSQVSKTKDTRLAFYETNQKQIPIIAGDVIPVSVKSYDDYRNQITNPIQTAIKPFDTDGLLEGDWLNSRGAIARIDRGTIEIRLIDTQECAKADLTLVQLVVAMVRSLINDPDFLKRADALETKSLHAIYSACVREAESAHISDPKFLALFAIQPTTAQNLWKHLVSTHLIAIDPQLRHEISSFLTRPSLATRITRAVGSNPTREKIKAVYANLCDCLDKNEVFSPESASRPSDKHP